MLSSATTTGLSGMNVNHSINSVNTVDAQVTTMLPVVEKSLSVGKRIDDKTGRPV